MWTVMRVWRKRSTNLGSWLLVPQLLPQASPKPLPFAAIFFVAPLSWLIGQSDGIPPRICGIVSMAPYKRNRLFSCNVPEK